MYADGVCPDLSYQYAHMRAPTATQLSRQLDAMVWEGRLPLAASTSDVAPLPAPMAYCLLVPPDALGDAPMARAETEEEVFAVRRLVELQWAGAPAAGRTRWEEDETEDAENYELLLASASELPESVMARPRQLAQHPAWLVIQRSAQPAGERGRGGGRGGRGAQSRGRGSVPRGLPPPPRVPPPPPTERMRPLPSGSPLDCWWELASGRTELQRWQLDAWDRDAWDRDATQGEEGAFE